MFISWKVWCSVAWLHTTANAMPDYQLGLFTKQRN